MSLKPLGRMEICSLIKSEAVIESRLVLVVDKKNRVSLTLYKTFVNLVNANWKLP